MNRLRRSDSLDDRRKEVRLLGVAEIGGEVAQRPAAPKTADRGVLRSWEIEVSRADASGRSRPSAAPGPYPRRDAPVRSQAPPDP